MSQASIWVIDQPPELRSLLRSNQEVAEDHECDYCETNFQNPQFLSYRHVIHFKKILRSYWLQISNKKLRFLIQHKHVRQKYIFMNHFRLHLIFENSTLAEFKFWRKRNGRNVNTIS